MDWSSFGVVVTADCDIWRSKHAGVLSYVPVLEYTEYLRVFRLPKSIEKPAKALGDDLVRQIRQQQSVQVPDYEDVSTEVALDWIMDVPPAEVAEELGITNPEEQQSFVSLAELFREATLAASEGSFAEQMSVLAHLRERNGLKNAQEQIAADFAALARNLPGDAFYVSSLGADHRKGYVVYLRLVREIKQDEIATTQSQLRKGKVRARRVSRMKSPYIYRMTQLLADVFAAIGLPEEYETSRDTVAADATVRSAGGGDG